MQREYMRFVADACKNGMTPEEVQNLFSDMLIKSNTKQGARVIRLFSKGIGKAKKKSFIQQYQNAPLENQEQISQEKSYQYIYK